TLRKGMCAVTSATVSFPPVKHIAKFFTPQRSEKNSVCPGNLKPISYIRALWTGPVTMASNSPRRASVTASSSAAAAARAVSGVGSPGLQFGCRPRTTYSVESGTRPDFRASSTISGPIPAQSPSVMPMRGFGVLVLMLVIVTEFVRSARTGLDQQRRGRLRGSGRKEEEEERNALERFDVSFLPQTGDPAILNLLGFFLDQSLLDIGTHFVERLRAASVFILNLQDVIITGVIDDVADSADGHVEGELFQRFRQSFALDPPPVATVVLRAVLGIHLRHLLELCATGELAEHFFGEFFLRRRASGILMAGNHDHSQFDLLLRRKFIAMFPVVLFDLCRRNNGVRLYVLAAHRSHNDFFHLLLLELPQRVVLRFQRFDKRVAVATKRFLNDLMYSLIHDMIRDFVAFFLERLYDEPPIDQIFYCHLAQFRQFFRQFVPRVLLTKQSLLRRG